MTNAVETDTWKLVGAERRQLVADLAGMAEADLAVPSGLPGWTAKAVLAHTVMPFLVPKVKFIGSMMRFRGDLDRVNNKYAARLSRRPVSELVEALTENVDSKWTPPGAGVGLPLTEAAVHAQDIRRALGIGYSVPTEVRDAILAHVASGKTVSADYRRAIETRLAPVG